MLEFTSPMTVSKAFRMSWESLLNPAIILRLLIPVVLTLAICISIISWGWPLVTTEIVPYLNHFSFIKWSFGNLERWFGFSVLTVFAIALFLAAIFFAIYFILLLLSAWILVPMLTPTIQKRYFPQVTENSELSIFGSFQNSISAILYFLMYLIALSPIILFMPGGQFIVPFLLNAYLARRTLPYDVLQNYATVAEFERFRLKENRSLWSLSIISGAFFYVPIVNFLAAPLTALSFTFFCLGKIAEYRGK